MLRMLLKNRSLWSLCSALQCDHNVVILHVQLATEPQVGSSVPHCASWPKGQPVALGKLPTLRAFPEEGNGKPLLNSLCLENPEKGHHTSDFDLTAHYVICSKSKSKSKNITDRWHYFLFVKKPWLIMQQCEPFENLWAKLIKTRPFVEVLAKQSLLKQQGSFFTERCCHPAQSFKDSTVQGSVSYQESRKIIQPTLPFAE